MALDATFKTNFPSRSVAVPFVVPSSTTVTPISGSLFLLSNTVPDSEITFCPYKTSVKTRLQKAPSFWKIDAYPFNN